MKTPITLLFFCAAFALQPTLITAADPVLCTQALQDNGQVIKADELPKPIKNALGADHRGWTVTQAVLINKANNTGSIATPDAANPASYYEVSISNGNESKVLKYHKDGTLLK